MRQSADGVAGCLQWRQCIVIVRLSVLSIMTRIAIEKKEVFVCQFVLYQMQKDMLS